METRKLSALYQPGVVVRVDLFLCVRMIVRFHLGQRWVGQEKKMFIGASDNYVKCNCF